MRATLARKATSTSLRAEGDVLALAAEETTRGEVVADVILHWFSADHATGEIGYITHPAHTGKGYATEASKPLLWIAFDALVLHRVIGRLEARNTASRVSVPGFTPARRNTAPPQSLRSAPSPRVAARASAAAAVHPRRASPART